MSFKYLTVVLLLVSSLSTVLSAVGVDPRTAQSAYNTPFIPHSIDMNAEYYPGFYSGMSDVETPLDTTPPTVLTKVLNGIGRIGVYVLGAAAVILVGAFFTTLVCTYTPFCTITINGFPTINKDTMKSFVNPDNMSTAAAFVQTAVDKYERFQREAKRYY